MCIILLVVTNYYWPCFFSQCSGASFISLFRFYCPQALLSSTVLPSAEGSEKSLINCSAPSSSQKYWAGENQTRAKRDDVDVVDKEKNRQIVVFQFWCCFMLTITSYEQTKSCIKYYRLTENSLECFGDLILLISTSGDHYRKNKFKWRMAGHAALYWDSCSGSLLCCWSCKQRGHLHWDCRTAKSLLLLETDPGVHLAVDWINGDVSAADPCKNEKRYTNTGTV